MTPITAKTKELGQDPIGDMLDRYFIQPVEAALASRAVRCPEQKIDPPVGGENSPDRKGGE